MQPFFSIKNLKRQKKVMEFLFGIKNFKTVMVFFFSELITQKVARKWRSPFLNIKNFNRRKAVMELFLSF